MEKSEGRVDFSSLLARSFKSSSVAALESSLSVSRCEGNHQTSKGADEASDESDVSEVFHGLFERSCFGFDILIVIYKSELVNWLCASSEIGIQADVGSEIHESVEAVV